MILQIVAGVVASYVVFSLVLLFFPGILHKKKQAAFVCQHISHRGGAGEGPENTIAAFEHAVVDCGTDMLELDCHLSRDGRVVVAHDPHLRRAGQPELAIAELDYAQLPPLLTRLPLDFAPGESFDASAFDDRSLPLLSEVFERFPDTPINIDIKVNRDELVAAVGRLVAQYRRQAITVWGNFSATVTNKCYRQDPSIGLLCSMPAVVKIVLSAYVGLLPFLPLRETFFEVPMPSILYPMVKGRFAKCMVWLADKLLMRPFILNHLRRRGMQVYLWVLNSEAEYRRAFELGATGVMTDYPSLLRHFLRDNPQYAAPGRRLKQ
ncbi:lysophospholipase D GDPD1-like [Amphibalanus amphitrite]|uniref:lysophospholipase D GDPD1-like n=1 Tax=Amphibalanus amphitrite TaxID=1232801 RepID=UPI001C91585A|nr:lysophospholipase D GDPD1-like [Amphibalanus amphitrite]XP_043203628.1 lysophospholipase D GDPD1-like [Amphibalanus amphitrite]